MAVLDHFAQAAAVILLVELMVVLIIFLAIAGGLAFGLRWVRGKTGWAFGYANKYSDLAAVYVRKATDYAALPVIKAGRFAAQIEGTLESIKTRVRTLRRAQPPVPAGPMTTPTTSQPATAVEPAETGASPVS